MARANKCLEDLEKKYNYDLVGSNWYQITGEKPVEKVIDIKIIESHNFTTE